MPAKLRTRPFYFHYVDVNPKNANEVWVNELDAASLARRRQDVHDGADAARRQPRHLVQSRQPRATRSAGQRRRRQRHTDGGRDLVEHPQPADGRALHGRGGRTASVPASTLRSRTTRPSSSRACRPCRSASTIRAGLDAGAGLRDRRHLADAPTASVIWGACKGEVGGINVETGQAKGTAGSTRRIATGTSRTRSSSAFRVRPSSCVSPHDPEDRSIRPRTSCTVRQTKA